jgi:hypothetical protein
MDCGFDGPIAVFDMNLAANYFNSENATGGFRDPSVAAGPHGPVRYAVGDGRLEFYQICEWLYGELTSRGVRCVQAWTSNADAKVAELVRDGFEGHKVACAYSTDCDVYVNSPKSIVGLHFKDGPKDQRTPVVCLFDRDQCLMDRGILPILPPVAADKDAARDVLAVFAALGRLTSDRVKKRKSRLDATNPCVLYQMMRIQPKQRRRRLRRELEARARRGLRPPRARPDPQVRADTRPGRQLRHPRHARPPHDVRLQQHLQGGNWPQRPGPVEQRPRGSERHPRTLRETHGDRAHRAPRLSGLDARQHHDALEEGFRLLFK